MNRRMVEEQAKKTFERAVKMEQEFGEYFTGRRRDLNIFISLNLILVLNSFQVLFKEIPLRKFTLKSNQ